MVKAGDMMVSIVLVVHNGSKYLRDSIDSCLNQSWSDLELIVVDDGSSDTVFAIIESYTDERIKYIRNKTPLGMAGCVNTGFREAKGRYLTFSSCEHQYLPSAVKEMLSFLQEHPEVDFVYSDMEVLNLETGERRVKSCSHTTFYFENTLGSSYLFTRKVYAAVGELDSCFELLEDYDYWLRVEKKFTLRRLPKVLYRWGYCRDPLSMRGPLIEILGPLLRFRHGYVNFEGLSESIGISVAKFLPFKKDSRDRLALLVQKISKFDLKLQTIFWTATGFSIMRKSGTAAKMVYKRFFKKDRSFTSILTGLKGPSNEKTQVLCVIPRLTMGGSEKVMQDVVAGLTAHGYDFHLFCFKQDDNHWVKKFLSCFVNSIVIPEVTQVDVYTDQIVRIINRLGIKMLLLTNEHITYKALPKIKQQFPGLKVVDIIHLEHVGGSHKHLSILTASQIDCRVCISRHLLNYMKEQYEGWGIPSSLAGRLRVVHNGTHLREFSFDKIGAGKFHRKYGIPPQTKIISFASRMTPEKNPFIFVEIARGIIMEGCCADLRFVMAGNGPLWRAVKARIKDHGLEKYFILPGLLTNVSELLRDSYLLVMVSTHEGIPLAIQEAMLMNVPVISTRVGAIHEIIHDGVNGFLVPSDEYVVENCRTKIKHLIEDEKDYQQMLMRTRESVYPEFTLETMCRRYEEILADVLEKKTLKTQDALEKVY